MKIVSFILFVKILALVGCLPHHHRHSESSSNGSGGGGSNGGGENGNGNPARVGKKHHHLSYYTNGGGANMGTNHMLTLKRQHRPLPPMIYQQEMVGQNVEREIPMASVVVPASENTPLVIQKCAATATCTSTRTTYSVHTSLATRNSPKVQQFQVGLAFTTPDGGGNPAELEQLVEQRPKLDVTSVMVNVGPPTPIETLNLTEIPMQENPGYPAGETQQPPENQSEGQYPGQQGPQASPAANNSEQGPSGSSDQEENPQ